MAVPRHLLFLILLFTAGLTSVRSLGDIAGDSDSFPGWLGASFHTREDKRKHPSAEAQPQAGGVDMRRVKQLSAWKPRAYLYEGFLTEEECDHLMNKANPRLQRSSVANNNNGRSEVSEIRTSSGMFIGKGEDGVIKRIEQRISEWTMLPTANQEALQVLRYTKGQKYEPHVDYFHDPVNTQRGGHRYATVLMYLNTPGKGGETVFPTARDATPKDDTWSDCAKGFLAVKPRKGDALLFFSMLPDGAPDDTSMHYACPVVEGEKWSAPMWIHVADFTKAYKAHEQTTQSSGAVVSDRTGCSDTNALCSIWAQRGECKKNPVYMLAACKKSCNTC